MRAQLLKSLLILLGISMFLSYIWIRFIRTRLPKDIPFTFSILGFFIIIYVCFIYAFIIFNVIKSLDKEKSSESIFKQVIKDIVDTIFLPLCTFDQCIKNLPITQKYHKKFMVYLAYKLNYNIVETDSYYYFMAIIPRIILATALFIDTFWFHKLYYIYKVLLLGIFLVLNRYIIYSFKHIKESLIKELKLLTNGMVVIPFIAELHAEHYAQIYHEDKETNPNFDESDWDWELDDIPPTLYIKDIELFINFQVLYPSKLEYYLHTSDEMMKTIKGAENVSYKTNYHLYMKYSKEAGDILKTKMEDILQISYIIAKYEVTHQSTATIKLKIFSYYLICWSYILIISAHTLNLESLMIMLNSTWEKMLNPFE
jgi:hypothetical protein